MGRALNPSQEQILHQNFIRAATAAAVAAAFSAAAVAGGFQLTEQSALGLGRAYAGMGVDGTDVSGLYYNPATITLHQGTQAQFGFVGVGLNLDYNAHDGGSNSDENGRKKPEAVPNLFISHQINDVTWIGFGFTVPFGLSTEYNEDWEQAGEGTEAKIEVYDFNPTVAWKVSEKFSLGAGISYQYVKADLGFNWSEHSQLGAAKPGMAYTKVSGDAWGWNVGMMWTPVENVRIGASYRSAVGHTVDGTLKTDSNVMLPNGQGGHISLPTTMSAQVSMDAPAWALLSAAWDVNDWLSLYGSMRWADWSSFKSLTIETPQADFASKKNWKDTYLYAIGYDARINSFWTLRGGIAYETSTIDDKYTRTGTIPDADRWWFAIGSSFHWTKDFQTDVGFAHLHGVHERSLYDSNHNEMGKFRKLDAYIIGIQGQYRF